MLPKVTKETMSSISHDHNGLGKTEYFAQVIDRMKADNPYIVGFIEGYSNATPEKVRGMSDGAVRGYFSQGMLLIYRMLESQAEADDMKGWLGATKTD